MFGFDLCHEYLSDFYVSSLLISIFAVVITFALAKVNLKALIIKNQPDKSSEFKEKESGESLTKENCDSKASHVKKSSVLLAKKVIEANMTDEQRLHEDEIRRKQLAEIFELMQKQSDKFGKVSLSEVEEQMKLYH